MIHKTLAAVAALLVLPLAVVVVALTATPAAAVSCTHHITEDYDTGTHGVVFRNHFRFGAKIKFAQCHSKGHGQWSDPRNLLVKYRRTGGSRACGSLRQVEWVARIWDDLGHQIVMGGALPCNDDGWEEAAYFIAPGKAYRFRRSDGVPPRWEVAATFNFSQSSDLHLNAHGTLWDYANCRPTPAMPPGPC